MLQNACGPATSVKNSVHVIKVYIKATPYIYDHSGIRQCAGSWMCQVVVTSRQCSLPDDIEVQ